MADHQLSNFIWQIADLLRGPYRPPQYERVMLPMVVLRRFDCVLRDTKPAVLARYEQLKDRLQGEALDSVLNKIAGQRFHNHSSMDFERLKGDPDHINQHLDNYIQSFSKNVRDIFDRFDFYVEIERMYEANVLYLVISKFCDPSLRVALAAGKVRSGVGSSRTTGWKRLWRCQSRCFTTPASAPTSGSLPIARKRTAAARSS
jgi:type I restriction enzyme M protein